MRRGALLLSDQMSVLSLSSVLGVHTCHHGLTCPYVPSWTHVPHMPADQGTSGAKEVGGIGWPGFLWLLNRLHPSCTRSWGFSTGYINKDSWLHTYYVCLLLKKLPGPPLKAGAGSTGPR